jgi:hypothetical protein
MTDSFSTYPEDMKLNLHNVATWENYVQKVISAYSDMGTAIRKNIPFVLHRPTIEDMFPDIDVRMYNFVPTVLAEDEEAPPRILDAPSYSALSAAMVLYMKMDKSRRDEEAKLCTFLSISIMDAPNFPKNSKNLLIQDRNVRIAYHDGIINPVHVQSAGFTTDLNAKPSGPTDLPANVPPCSTLLPIRTSLITSSPPVPPTSPLTFTSLYCL